MAAEQLRREFLVNPSGSFDLILFHHALAALLSLGEEAPSLPHEVVIAVGAPFKVRITMCYTSTPRDRGGQAHALSMNIHIMLQQDAYAQCDAAVR